MVTAISSPPTEDRPTATTGTSAPGRGRTRGRVYVVDDDASVRKALGRLLRASGYAVEIFGTAEEYLAGAAPAVPACLVVDVRMPGMGGLDLQAALAGTARELPIVFITGHADRAAQAQALAAGAVDVLLKPLNAEDLLAAIERALGRSARPS
jgi:FixJ family two-component response regulator